MYAVAFVVILTLIASSSFILKCYVHVWHLESEGAGAEPCISPIRPTPDAMRSTWHFATRCCCCVHRRPSSKSSASRHVVPFTSIWNRRVKTGHIIIIAISDHAGWAIRSLPRRRSHLEIAGPIKPTSQNWLRYHSIVRSLTCFLLLIHQPGKHLANCLIIVFKSNLVSDLII